MLAQAGLGLPNVAALGSPPAAAVQPDTGEPQYDYPVGHGLYSDYGIRASKLGQNRYIIGRR